MRWREWTPDERLRSQARAAYLFLNIVPCPECGLPWAQGYIHPDCPGGVEPEQADGMTAAKARDDLERGTAHFDREFVEWRGTEVEVVD